MIYSNRCKLSIIIPVFKEAPVINNLIMDIINRYNNDEFEIIVVDGSNDHDTIKAIKIDADNIKKMVSKKNRANQMNEGASVSNGDVLLFLHADCVLPEDALNQINDILGSDPAIVAGAFNLKIDSNKIIFRIISKLSSLRSRLTNIPYGDQAIFIRKKYFLELGAYKEIPIMEDVDLMRRIKKNKGKIKISSSCAIASPRRWEKEGVLYCTFRNWIILSLYFLGISPDRLKIFYYKGRQ